MKRIFAMLSHNIISPEGVARVNASDIEFILSTDTVDNPNIVGQPKFKTVSVRAAVCRDDNPLLQLRFDKPAVHHRTRKPYALYNREVMPTRPTLAY